MTEGATNPIAGNAGKVYVYDVEFDLAPVTTADSATWVMSDTGGETVASGTLEYTSSLLVDGLTSHDAWFANVRWPELPQDVNVWLRIVKQGETRDWNFRVTVKPGRPE